MTDARAILESHRRTHAAMHAAHDEGRHGDGTNAAVVAYWKDACADCAAVWRYDFSGIFGKRA